MAALQEALVHRIGEPRFHLWFENKTKFHYDNGLLVVGVPNLHFQDWLQTTFADHLRAAAAEVIRGPIELRFTIDPELFRAARQEQANGHVTHSEREENRPRREPKPDAAASASPSEAKLTPPTVRQWRTLREFVVGPCNRVAHACAERVVEAPGTEANPFVLHGPVGTGKTHLLEGICCGLRQARPSWRVIYATSEEFTHRFVQAMRTNKLGHFRKHFRGCDVLLLDDIHFLAPRKVTQEEFLHTLNALQAEGKQVVFTLDGHPKLTEKFVPELIDRLVGGAVWTLSSPEEATRLAVLKAKAALLEIQAPVEVLRFLAGQLHGNVRELLGALHSIHHLGRVTGAPIDLALARTAVGDLLRHSVRSVHLADVDRAVCQVFGLASRALQSKERTWFVSHPRMVAMYLARQHTAAAYSEIGSYFGNRNHSTVIAAEKKVRQWLNAKETIGLGARQLGIREAVELVARELQR